MKTAEEILSEYETIQHESGSLVYYENVIHAMEEYANQFKQDWTKECQCGEESTGEMWCCNICGNPTSKHTQSKSSDVSEEMKELENKLNYASYGDRKPEELKYVWEAFFKLKDKLSTPSKKEVTEAVEFAEWIAKHEYAQTVRPSLKGMWTNDTAIYYTHKELYNHFKSTH